MTIALARNLVDSQMRLTHAIDRVLPEALLIDGNRDFLDRLAPHYLNPGSVLYDVGGGKNPMVSEALKSELGLRVVGIDIDQEELDSAPAARYDHTIAADITRFQGNGDADLVVCQALLEHVRDTDGALRAIASILKPGGRALIFVPSRNAVYARLNLLLSEEMKRRILFSIFPGMRRNQGFPAFYDRCTPRAFRRMATRHGLETEECRVYFHSDYFRFCAPVYAAWRLWTTLFRAFAGEQAAETFSLVLRKK
jgi:2-polyprenyl-6-hydroxyphenyl methylase/3-demethylubiquinone-9 3-methyltransferase